MKCATLLKAFLLFVITASALQPVAASNNNILPEVKISTIPAEKKIGLEISNVKQLQTIYIKDQSGIVLLSEELQPGQRYARLINLKELPVGKRYFLVLDNDLQKQIYPFMLTEQGAVMENANQKVLYKPVINLREDHIDLSYFNGQVSNVEVAFYDQNGEEFFSESMDYVIKVEKRYKLKSFTPGQYMLKVTTPSEAYVRQFEVK